MKLDKFLTDSLELAVVIVLIYICIKLLNYLYNE